MIVWKIRKVPVDFENWYKYYNFVDSYLLKIEYQLIFYYIKLMQHSKLRTSSFLPAGTCKKNIWWVVRQYAMHVFLTQSTSDSNNYLQRRCHCCLLNIMAVIFINMYDETSKVTTFIQQLLETLDLRLFRSIISIWTTTCAARL